MNYTERPTPLTNSEASRIGGYSQLSDRVSADFARTLERSLAERTEERGKSYKFNQALADAMTIDRQSIVALNEENERLKRQLDTTIAKLAKCRESLAQIAESGRGNTVWAETRPAQIARQTLGETK
jgi:hypothetical protein